MTAPPTAQSPKPTTRHRSSARAVLTIAVWIGFPEGNRTILKGETGGSLAFPVWKKLIEGLPAEYAFAPLAELPLMTASQ